GCAWRTPRWRRGMSGARKPAVAGLFYPADPDKLRAAVGRALEVDVPADETAPKAIIAPHAGYQYSGPTAGVAYARLRPLRGRISRVVLAGPAHRAFVDGVA